MRHDNAWCTICTCGIGTIVTNDNNIYFVCSPVTSVKIRCLSSDPVVVSRSGSTIAHRGRTAAIGCVNDGDGRRNGHRRTRAFSSGIWKYNIIQKKKKQYIYVRSGTHTHTHDSCVYNSHVDLFLREDQTKLVEKIQRDEVVRGRREVKLYKNHRRDDASRVVFLSIVPPRDGRKNENQIIALQ